MFACERLRWLHVSVRCHLGAKLPPVQSSRQRHRLQQLLAREDALHTARRLRLACGSRHARARVRHPARIGAWWPLRWYTLSQGLQARAVGRRSLWRGLQARAIGRRPLWRGGRRCAAVATHVR